MIRPESLQPARHVGLVLVSPVLRRQVSPADWAAVEDGATFAIVARAASGNLPGSDYPVTILATDSDVPPKVDPVVYGRRCADAKADVWLGVQPDLLYCLTAAGWTAWDSKARTEERRIPADVRYPVAGEALDFVVRAPQMAGSGVAA